MKKIIILIALLFNISFFKAQNVTNPIKLDSNESYNDSIFELEAERFLEEIDEKESNKIFLVVEQQPIPKGGLQAFYKYIGTHIKYPEQARRAWVQGRVFVQFVIDKDGSITDVKAVKGIGRGCDEEAVRVVKNAPKWNPGIQKGRPVRVRMMIPISFSLPRKP